jgi:hypothetical protein
MRPCAAPAASARRGSSSHSPLMPAKPHHLVPAAPLRGEKRDDSSMVPGRTVEPRFSSTARVFACVRAALIASWSLVRPRSACRQARWTRKRFLVPTFTGMMAHTSRHWDSKRQAPISRADPLSIPGLAMTARFRPTGSSFLFASATSAMVNADARINVKQASRFSVKAGPSLNARESANRHSRAAQEARFGRPKGEI